MKIEINTSTIGLRKFRVFSVTPEFSDTEISGADTAQIKIWRRTTRDGTFVGYLTELILTTDLVNTFTYVGFGDTFIQTVENAILQSNEAGLQKIVFISNFPNIRTQLINKDNEELQLE